MKNDELLSEEEAAKYLTPKGTPKDKAITADRLKRMRWEHRSPAFITIRKGVVGYLKKDLDEWLEDKKQVC